MSTYKIQIRAILIDLNGTLHVGDEPTPGAVEALKRFSIWIVFESNHVHFVWFFSLLRLKQNPNISVRFVTNTTKESKQTLLSRLQNCGFENISPNDLYTSLSAAEHYVRTNNLRPFYLLSDDALNDFADIDQFETGTENAVVVGLAPDRFHYEKLNDAFRWADSSKNSHTPVIHVVPYAIEFWWKMTLL